ncbi:hypothetical protein F9802_00985 [Bacillus aerolatus]|uniref:DUF4190 domain-containing protein n=1 Tax=Bacillus aerolatus TaxID=2653354 RepID=A0A6I1FNB5_9BACI|nr:hypothetical protein [Bacillus aerolatus]KAB7708757.1 hypothetical protein F9802_00985 [Bacillus aerolatus]
MNDDKFDKDLRLANRPNKLYEEETAAELATPLSLSEERTDSRIDSEEGGRGFGYTGLIVSIVALFVMPVLLGAVGIVLGFLARSRGSRGLGSWAIGVGAAAIIMGLFVLPFF